jgi:diguanylate cyclase
MQGGAEVREKPGALARLRADFDLAILFSFGLIAALVVAGFAIFRLLSGNLLGALVNCGVVVFLLAVMGYAWSSGNTRRAGALFVLVTAGGCIASTVVFGRTGVFWTFMVLWIHFVLTRRDIALAVNLTLILVVAAQGSLFEVGTERVAYAVTALLITTYGWIFSSRYDAQRQQLESLASHDPLTGAGNRRLLQHDLVGAVEAMRRHQQPAVLAVLDLDHFKRVNDALGHEAGDRVLVELIGIVRGRLRKADGVYRFGGEEFVVLLPHTEAAPARTLLQDLHRLINDGLGEGTPVAVTVSIGGAPLRPDEDWSTWLGRADAAMYRAKQSGRNRVVMHGDAAELAVHPGPIP